jgi:adenylate cyclase
MRPVWQLVLITGACNLIATVHGVFYGYLSSGQGFDPQSLMLLYKWAICMFLLSYIIAPMIFIKHFWPVDNALLKISKNESLDSNTLEVARKNALHLPTGLARISTIVWIFVSLSFLPLYLHFFPGEIILPAIHVSVVSLLIGSISSCFTYYASEWYCRRKIIPVLFPDGGLNRVQGANRVTIQFKILVLIVTTCVLPVGVLSLTALLGTAKASVIIYLGTTFLIIGVLQGKAIARSINDPLQEVVMKMDLVKQGNLSVKARVLSNDSVGELSEGFNSMVEGLERAEIIRESFGRYISPEVLDKVLQGDVELSGEMRHATVLFCDIRDFTSISEKLPPAKLVERLNECLDIIVNAVVENGGRVDKFMGDCVMAVFGVPMTQEDHALRAINTGLDILKRIERWNSETTEPDSIPWKVGVGMHSGEIVAGNIGSSKKMEYAIIGDVVNTASRIEQLNKKLGTDLLISEQTYSLVEDMVQARKYDQIKIKGKDLPMTVFMVSRLENA